MLNAAQLMQIRQDALLIDLASAPGGDDCEDKGRCIRMTDKFWRIFVIGGVILTAALALVTFFATQPKDELRTVRIQAAAEQEMPPQTTADTETTVSAVLHETTTELRTQESFCAETTIITTMPDTDLNTADPAALMRVSGIGSVLAERIVGYRAALGGFTRRSQLTEIEGIGEELAARILEAFHIEGELPPAVPAVTAPPQSAEPEPAAGTTEAPAPGYYELNHVTREELLTIPGIDEEKADAILSLREELGGFLSINELWIIESLSGDYIVHELTNYLYVENDTAR